MEIEAVDARTLLHPERMDYVVKHRFFRHLIEGNDPDAERVYRWHILKRTGGKEPVKPGRPVKTTVQDYVDECGRLLKSLSQSGFDPNYAVPIGTAGTPRDGAHRISACLALNIPVLVTRVNRGPTREWGRGWFERAGMSASDLRDLDRAWASLSGAV